MRDIWAEQLNWVESGEPFVLARVIRTWRSAPRKSGAGMLIGKGMDKDSLPKVARFCQRRLYRRGGYRRSPGCTGKR